MRQYALAVMAKAPEPGRVKTRLVPPLSYEEAAELALCLLVDTLLKTGELSGVDRYLAYTPAEAKESMQRLLPQPFTLIPQVGSDLGERLDHLATTLLERRHPTVILIGIDTPTLPSAYLSDAVARLQDETADLVLGPAEDGGYYLIGLTRPHPRLFEGISWGGPAVLAETLRQAETERLRVALLPSWFDLDSPQDLDRLRQDLERDSGLTAPHTWRWLKATDLRGRC